MFWKRNKQEPVDPVKMVGLWKRTIELEHPPGSDLWEQAKPVGYLLGGHAELGRDVDSWFPPPLFTWLRDRCAVWVDEITRRYYFAGPSTTWKVEYTLQENTTNVAGIRYIPIGEDPVQTKIVAAEWDSGY